VAKKKLSDAENEYARKCTNVSLFLKKNVLHKKVEKFDLSENDEMNRTY
jgi:hypothetical protein